MSARLSYRFFTNLRSPSRILQLSRQLTPIQSRTMASLPTTMRGVIIEKNGGVEVLQYKTDLPLPTPKDGEVLIKNDYIGVNYIDTYFRTGLYPVPHWPFILGREGEGTIISTSGAHYDLIVGSRVAYMNPGAYAEYTAVPAKAVHALPSGLAPGVGAAAMLQGLTALTLIREAHHVQKGDWVLVHAAAGGVGLLLCQLLRAVGAKTIGTASTPDKIKLAKENGAGWMINYKEEDVVEKVKEIAGEGGVRVVFDSTGKDQFENDLKVVGRKGSIVSFGNSSGAVPPFEISKLAAKNLKVLRPTLFNYIAEREEFEGYTAELFDFILKGDLNVRVHETYPLAEVGRAHSDLEARKTTGKLLLKP